MSNCRSSHSVGFRSRFVKSSSGISGGGITGSTITLAPMLVSDSIPSIGWMVLRLKSGKWSVTAWSMSLVSPSKSTCGIFDTATQSSLRVVACFASAKLFFFLCGLFDIRLVPSKWAKSSFQNPPLPGSCLDRATLTNALFRDRLCLMEFCKRIKNICIMCCNYVYLCTRLHSRWTKII